MGEKFGGAICAKDKLCLKLEKVPGRTISHQRPKVFLYCSIRADMRQTDAGWTPDGTGCLCGDREPEVPSANRPPASSNLPSFTFLYLRLQLYESQRSLFTQRSNLSFLSKHQITRGLTYPRTVAFPREQKGHSAGWTDRLDKISSLQLLTEHKCNYSPPPRPPAPAVLTISSLSVPQDKQAGVCFHVSIVFVFAASVLLVT